MIDLSIVIPTHDKRRLLQTTLAALQRQDLEPERWELIVVDDASSDDTAEWLQGAKSVWNQRLRIVSCPENVGRARARNLGAGKAAGRWLLFLDDDIVAPPGLLRAHIRELETGPQCGVIGMVVTEPSLVDSPHFHYIDSRGIAKTTSDTVPAKYLVTQNTSVPREAFIRCGGFDERFTAYGFEDMELGFRLEESAGIVFRALRQPVPVHIHHHDLNSYLHKKVQCGHGSLQLLNELCPARMHEMKLGGVFAQPRLVRFLLARLQPILKSALSVWPAGAVSKAPLFRCVYGRFMDLAIYASYCQGVLEYDTRPDKRLP